MDMIGEQRIGADRETVWKALNDAEILGASIPGCQELIKESDTQMTAIAVVKVGPISARFQGKVTLSDLDPPNSYRITGEGQGGVAGHAKGSAMVSLVEQEGETLLRYEVSAQVGGRLAQLGGRMIDATARTMSAAFFKKFAQEIARRQEPSSDASPASTRAPEAMPSAAPAKAVMVASGAVDHGRAPLWVASGFLFGVLLAGLLASRYPSLNAGGGAQSDVLWGAAILLAIIQGYLLGRQNLRS